jgi:uncharacterized protein
MILLAGVAAGAFGAGLLLWLPSASFDAAVPWLPAFAGAVVGGYAGAHLVRRLPAAVLRALVLTTAVAMTALFFIRAAV